jgi:hypothetical protein
VSPETLAPPHEFGLPHGRAGRGVEAIERPFAELFLFEKRGRHEHRVAGHIHRCVDVPFRLPDLPDDFRLGLEQHVVVGRNGEVGILLLLLLVLGEQFLPPGLLQFGNLGEGEVLAIECRLVEFDAENTGSAAADIDFAAGDGGAAFEVNQVPGQWQLPERAAGGCVEAMQQPAGILVHAVAENEHFLLGVVGWRRNRRELQVRRGLGPDRFDFSFAGEREESDRRAIEAAESGDVELIADDGRRCDEVVLGFHGPQYGRRGRPGLIVGVAGALGVAAIRGPRRGIGGN